MKDWLYWIGLSHVPRIITLSCSGSYVLCIKKTLILKGVPILCIIYEVILYYIFTEYLSTVLLRHFTIRVNDNIYNARRHGTWPDPCLILAAPALCSQLPVLTSISSCSLNVVGCSTMYG